MKSTLIIAAGGAGLTFLAALALLAGAALAGAPLFLGAGAATTGATTSADSSELESIQTTSGAPV